ncbi:hypothetical protein ACJQWK_08693 [Exserohilum turcicum]|uniref:Uncharacterized protein n=1 Tax=Exserohilum turcicum (strain 28A) TaxID=671987 RepID=R0KHM7_EXST2|nr:uncharacterized protein SETTUDRAFT_109505 [Exserohilum turcica Et28A]EOA87547.1 hypothetical protein SETTUDRAFT_109505 [Exserohilum turcica Et28A]
MIFGGLEIVAGGYLLHRHYRKKNQKETGQEDAQPKRQHSFPGANCAHHAAARPQQKYAYMSMAPQPCPQTYPPQTPMPEALVAPQQPPRPQAPPHTQSFNIPRRPVPQRKPHIIIQPSLHRTDSFATLSRMPVANGYRPHDVSEQPALGLEPTQHHHGLYANAGYSVSTPAFGATPTSPGLTYEMATGDHDVFGHAAHDDNWDSYPHAYGAGARPYYAPTVSTELGEREPPPPYVP